MTEQLPDLDHFDHLEADGFRTLQRGDMPGGHYSYSDTEARIGLIVELLQLSPELVESVVPPGVWSRPRP